MESKSKRMLQRRNPGNLAQPGVEPETVGFLAISKSELPEEILLEPRYSPANLAGAQDPALIVRTELSDGQKVPSREPIWVYIKVYDKNRQVIKILHRTVDRENGAKFNQADFGETAVSAHVTAFWPGSVEQKVVDGSDRRGIERKVGETFYMPATAVVADLPRPGHEPVTVALRLKPMPVVIKRSAKFGGQPPVWCGPPKRVSRLRIRCSKASSPSGFP